MGLFNKNKDNKEIENNEDNFDDIDPTVVDATDEDIEKVEAQEEKTVEAPVEEPEEEKEDVVITEPEEDEGPMSAKAQAKAQKEAEKREKEEAKKQAQAEAEEKKHAHLEDLGENKKGKKQKETPVFVFNRYKFAIKILAFAILLTFGIMILIFKEQAVGAIFLISGATLLVTSIIRLVPLLKTTKGHEARLVSLIEIIADAVIGVYMIAGAFIKWGVASGNYDSDSFMAKWDDFNVVLYGWLMIAVFAGRQLVYNWVVILCGEKTDRFKFWVHQIFTGCAIAIALFVRENNFAGILIWILAISSFASALVIGGEGGLGYYRYRKSLNKGSEKKKEKEAGKEAPARDTNDISDIDPNTIPVDDGGNRDSIVS